MTEGLKHLRRATELCPYDAFYWYSLGTACDLENDISCGDQAFERTVRLSPAVPRFQWAAANHYLMTDRVDQAFTFFHRLLELDPAYAWRTFQLCLRATRDPELIFNKILLAGANPMLNLTYVNFLSGEGDNLEMAHKVWTRTLSSTNRIPLTATEPYLDRLLALGRGAEAKSAWQDLQKVGVIASPDSSDRDNLIFNGDFERAPLNAGLDWRSSSVPFLYVDFADADAYHGARCLHLDFTVSRNEDYAGPYQFVPVGQNQEYVLQAFVKSRNITSDSGPRLQALDPRCPACLNVLSDTTVGTTPWHPVGLKFHTGPQTELVQIVICRPHGRSFPTEISGSFWVDDVTLKPNHPNASENH